ncbi:MAG: hypothetical protein ACT4QC_21580 [Planctomycetaceae bacterium]
MKSEHSTGADARTESHGFSFQPGWAIRDFDLRDLEVDPAGNEPNQPLRWEGESWDELRPLLEPFQKTIWPVYRRADHAARFWSNCRFAVVVIVATLGGAAVLAAIAHLADLNYPVVVIPNPWGEKPWRLDWLHWLTVREQKLAIVTLVAVIVGSIVWLHQGWVQGRFIAEQCRFLKFHLLFDPARWYRQDAQTINGELEQFLVNIQDLRSSRDGKPFWRIRRFVQRLQPTHRRKVHSFLHEWIVGHRALIPPWKDVPRDLPPEVTRQIVDYAVTKRLGRQSWYYSTEGERRRRWERLTRRIGPLSFFISVGAAIARGVWESFVKSIAPYVNLAENKAALQDVGTWMTLIAAGAPVVGAMARTFRGANEFGRNALRFEALGNRLAHWSVELQAVLARAPNDGPAQLQPLREAEEELEQEHRAWMRLMSDAEWYG